MNLIRYLTRLIHPVPIQSQINTMIADKEEAIILRELEIMRIEGEIQGLRNQVGYLQETQEYFAAKDAPIKTILEHKE